MKLYTHQVIGWDNEKRTDILKKIIINSEDIITISDFGYLKTHVLLKNGQYFVCGTVFFQNPTFYNESFNDAEEIICENHEFYEKIYEIRG